MFPLRFGAGVSFCCDGHIVKIIDKTGLKEYNYTYDEGSLVRAVEYDITMTGDIVVSKARVVTISYVYSDEGELLKKRAIFDNGSESTRGPAWDTDSSQFYSNASGTADFVTSSETDGLGRKTKDYFVTTSGRIERSFTYHNGEVTPEHVRYGKVKSGATTELVDKITYSDGRTTEYEYDAEERITKVTDSIDGITEYTYDSLGQLLTEKRNGVVINSMTYDGYGVSSFMTSRLNSTKENDISINVKYILNRDYDSKNVAYKNDSTSNCKNGVFYPIVHNTCVTQGDYKCTKC